MRDEPVLVPDEIYIAYGLFISRGLTVDAKQPVNVFAKIDDGLEQLKGIGARIAYAAPQAGHLPDKEAGAIVERMVSA